MKGLLISLGLIAAANHPSAATTSPPASAAVSIPAERTIPQMIEYSAAMYGVSTSTMTSVLRCESSLRPDAVGDSGESFGIAQIYRPAHPEISVDQALDPEFAIDYLAQQLYLGNGSMWTCFRNLDLSTGDHL